jgi:Carboxypeptidase regulatory-like domain
MKKEKLVVERTMQSLLKYGAFLVVMMMVVFACSNTEENAILVTEENTSANFTAKTDGAIMGSVIAPNATVEIIASNSEERIEGTTDENGEFFINGFKEGTYTITITTENTEKKEIFQDVEVRIGEVTALGTVALAVQ